MDTTTRAVLAAVTLALAIIPLGMLFSAAPPNGTVGTVLAVLAGVGGTAAACLWVVKFPTKNQSIRYAATCSTSIAMAALAQSDPLTGVLACTAYATISGYIAIFHTAPLMAANLIVIVGVSAVPAVRLATTNGVVWAACVWGLMLVVNLALPYGSQIIMHSLGVDVLRADRDALTGLYTRRAFYQRTISLVAGQAGDAHLVMAMIDLDKFKQLNDTRGHTEGDLVLAAVGRALCESTRRSAVVSRAGGEEFLVADVFADPRLDVLGQRLCDAVAALPHRITASVGLASMRCDEVLRGEDSALITTLVGTADAAMYAAKRNGGNGIRYRRSVQRSSSPGGSLRLWDAIGKRWVRASSYAHPSEASVPEVRTDVNGGDTVATAPFAITVPRGVRHQSRFSDARSIRGMSHRHATAKHRRH